MTVIVKQAKWPWSQKQCFLCTSKVRCAACQTRGQATHFLQPWFLPAATTYGCVSSQISSLHASLPLCPALGNVKSHPGKKIHPTPFSLAMLWGTKQLQLMLAAVFQIFAKIWERSVHSVSFAFSCLTIKTWHWWLKLKTAPSKSKWHHKRFHRVGASCIVATPALYFTHSKLKTAHMKNLSWLGGIVNTAGGRTVHRRKATC